MAISFKNPTADIRRKLEADAANVVKQQRGAVNDAARAVRVALYGELRSRLDRPTPYTVPAGTAEGVGAVRVEFAGQQGAQAAVMIRGRGQVPGGAIPQESYLRAQILGGGRRFKRLELALQRAGVMAAGYYAVPAGSATGRNGGGGGARFDAYGNLSRGQVVQIIAYFKAFGAGAVRSNSTDKTRARLAKDKSARRKNAPAFVPGIGFVNSAQPARQRERVRSSGRVYFAVKGPGRSGGLVPGVYERQGGGLGSRVRPVLYFVKSVAYKPRVDFEGVAERVAPVALANSLKRRVSSPRGGAGA